MERSYKPVEIYKEIMKLAWPSITEQLLIMMVGMVSTIFVGRIGTETIAAVGIINNLIFFFQTVFAGLSTGSTVIIARLIGEGNREKAKTALIQSLFLSIFAGALVPSLGYIFSTPILKLFFGAAEPKVFEIALLYYKLALIGLPFLVIDMVIAGSLRGAGDTKTPMYVTGIVNIINIVLSSILIFGVSIRGNVLVPALGVVGAGISVSAARICGGLIRLFVVYWRNGKLSLSFKDKYIIDMQMILRILRVGFPAFMEQAIMQGGFLIMQVIVVSMGTVSVAAYQIGVNVNSLAFMPMFGFAIAATTMVGQSLGRKDYDGAGTYAYESNRLAIMVTSCIGVLTFIFAKQLAMLYSRDPAVITLAAGVIRVFGVLEPLLALMNVSAGVLRAAGDIMYVMVSGLVGLWSFRVLISYILFKMFGIGVYGVMTGICFDFTVRAAMYCLRVRAGKWKLLKV